MEDLTDIMEDNVGKMPSNLFKVEMASRALVNVMTNNNALSNQVIVSIYTMKWITRIKCYAVRTVPKIRKIIERCQINTS